MFTMICLGLLFLAFGIFKPKGTFTRKAEFVQGTAYEEEYRNMMARSYTLLGAGWTLAGVIGKILIAEGIGAETLTFSLGLLVAAAIPSLVYQRHGKTQIRNKIARRR